MLLAGPFIVEGGVWDLAKGMSTIHSLFATLIVFVIGYGALNADKSRNLDKERKVLGIPVRFISLILVTYLSVFTLIYTLNAPTTYTATLLESMRVASIAAIFSIIGAATADSVL
ncbi:MAG: DUF2391 domain-containing protein [Candidatus Aenigmatarchaeota archaeon]